MQPNSCSLAAMAREDSSKRKRVALTTAQIEPSQLPWLCPSSQADPPSAKRGQAGPERPGGFPSMKIAGAKFAMKNAVNALQQLLTSVSAAPARLSWIFPLAPRKYTNGKFITVLALDHRAPRIFGNILCTKDTVAHPSVQLLNAIARLSAGEIGFSPLKSALAWQSSHLIYRLGGGAQPKSNKFVLKRILGHFRVLSNASWDKSESPLTLVPLTTEHCHCLPPRCCCPPQHHYCPLSHCCCHHSLDRAAA